MTKPLIISAPEPRSIPLIFTSAREAELRAGYDILEVSETAVNGLDAATLGRARYILGQPTLEGETIDKMRNLRCIFNVESNLINNMPYDKLFARGIHVVTTGAVFAEPVAELGLGLAIDLARQISTSHEDFRQSREAWGGDGNQNARLLSGSTIGIIGFGDLGRALGRLLTGFRPELLVHDPWLPASMIREAGAVPVSKDDLLARADTVFVTAAVTSENRAFIGAPEFGAMKKGAAFVLLSRAEVVDFDALMAAIASGHITAASDVYPEEPLASDHPVRTLDGFLHSAHRAGALDIAFKRMGDMVLEDMALVDKGLPPLRGKRAERETVARMRSKPVTKN